MLPAAPYKYGATTDLDKPDRISPVPLLSCTALGCIFQPVVVFMAVAYTRSMEIHYESGLLSLLICLLILLGMFPTCVLMWTGSQRTRSLFTFSFLSSILAWVLGFCSGDFNYHYYFKPYFDVKNLNTYPHVNPSIYYSQQYMDAGVINFVPGSHLDISKSYGFKNGNTYCVAPVVGPATAEDGFHGIGKMEYDFWAVGINCCSGHRPDFHCGEYSNPLARKGLRLMREEERDFFRLAVKAAGASYNIKTRQPLFMYWMQYPEDEIRAYVDDGWKYYWHSVFAYFLLTIVDVCIYWVCFIK